MHSKIIFLRLIVIVHAQLVLTQKTLTCSLTDQSVRNLLIQIVTLHATNPSVGWLLIQKFSTETSVEWPTTVSISRKSTDSGLECTHPLALRRMGRRKFFLVLFARLYLYKGDLNARKPASFYMGQRVNSHFVFSSVYADFSTWEGNFDFPKLNLFSSSVVPRPTLSEQCNPEKPPLHTCRRQEQLMAERCSCLPAPLPKCLRQVQPMAEHCDRLPAPTCGEGRSHHPVVIRDSPNTGPLIFRRQEPKPRDTPKPPVPLLVRMLRGSALCNALNGGVKLTLRPIHKSEVSAQSTGILLLVSSSTLPRSASDLFPPPFPLFTTKAHSCRMIVRKPRNFAIR